jgi:hypothetical protein
MATARMFSFDTAAEVMAKHMNEKISFLNVLDLDYTFCSYNFPTFEEETFQFILQNYLKWHESKNDYFYSHFLSRINLELISLRKTR